MEAATTRVDGDGAEDRDEALDRVQAALRGLRFGTVTVVIQDGVVVQIERMEKIRLGLSPTFVTARSTRRRETTGGKPAPPTRPLEGRG